jgi:hypothetical protein
MAKTIRELFKVTLFGILKLVLPGAGKGWKKVSRKNEPDLR